MSYFDFLCRLRYCYSIEKEFVESNTHRNHKLLGMKKKRIRNN